VQVRTGHERAETRRSGAGPNGLSLARWAGLCALAETIGMTAAAAAATASQSLIGEPATGREAVAVLSLVVAGGLVEGVSLGTLQSAGLRRVLPGLNRRRWVLVTTAVAGVGWAAGSAPSVLSDHADTASPPLLFMLTGALALGALMGALLGAVQARGLRGLVRNSSRWVLANAAAWAPAMAIIFLGAGTPGDDWPTIAVLAMGAVTGAAAGAVLGLVTGSVLPR
jgi:hypothetical protein